MRTLNDIMEFDHAVRVNEDGSVALKLKEED